MSSLLKHGEKPLTSSELGMLVGLSSFGMLFGTMILSYLLARARLPVWPPLGVEPIAWPLPALSTAVLLFSSWILQTGVNAFEARDYANFHTRWSIATLLGFAFLAVQALVWVQLSHRGLKLDTNLFGSIFYAMTGLHAIHVLGGIGALIWVKMKFGVLTADSVRAPNSNRLERSQAPKLAGWYWHFMGAVWVLMFVLVVVI